jgi:hypothetical protein
VRVKRLQKACNFVLTAVVIKYLRDEEFSFSVKFILTAIIISKRQKERQVAVVDGVAW